MGEVFVSKLRPIGSSVGVIIPKKILQEKNLSSGGEIRLAVIDQDFSALDKLFGSMKNVKHEFKRDKRDRI